MVYAPIAVALLVIFSSHMLCPAVDIPFASAGPSDQNGVFCVLYKLAALQLLDYAAIFQTRVLFDQYLFNDGTLQKMRPGVHVLKDEIMEYSTSQNCVYD